MVCNLEPVLFILYWPLPRASLPISVHVPSPRAAGREVWELLNYPYDKGISSTRRRHLALGSELGEGNGMHVEVKAPGMGRLPGEGKNSAQSHPASLCPAATGRNMGSVTWRGGSVQPTDLLLPDKLWVPLGWEGLLKKEQKLTQRLPCQSFLSLNTSCPNGFHRTIIFPMYWIARAQEGVAQEECMLGYTLILTKKRKRSQKRCFPR